MKRGCMLAVLLGACAETTSAPMIASEDSGELEPAAARAAEPSQTRAGDPAVDRDPAGPAEPAIDRTVPAAAAPSPRELTCVSGTSVLPDETFPSVWRVKLFIDRDATRATFVRSPLFQSHGGVWRTDGGSRVRDEVLRPSGPMRFSGGARDDIVIELTDDAPFFMGELQLDEASADVVCWDAIEIFGSPWSTRPLRLARYDDLLHECVGPDGKPAALNLLPLSFVLETHHGDCADLRGVRLNVDDYAIPDITLRLRGADLSDASLHFANLSGSFEGARLGALEYGYALVSGATDTATELPAAGDCQVVESAWAGNSVTCRR